MDPRFSFFSVDVEISNNCDLDCRMCARSRIVRPRGWMARSTFANIVRTLLPLKSRITLCGMGNPVSHPLWSEFVQDYKTAGGKIGLVIHGTHLTGQITEDLCRVEPHFVEISFPSANKEHFGTLCPKSHYETARDAVIHLAKAADQRFPVVVIGLQTGINPQEENVSKQHWQSFGLRTRVFPCHSRGGSLTDPALLTSPIQNQPVSGCGLIGMHSFVTWQGKHLACCHDLAGQTEFGDLNCDTLEILLERKAKYLNQYNPFPICAACDDPYRLAPRPSGPFPESDRARQKVLRRLSKMSAFSSGNRPAAPKKGS